MTEPMGQRNEKAFYGDKVLYVCDAGYTLDGVAPGKSSNTGKQHFEIECQANTMFSPVKECKPVDCGKPFAVDYATVDFDTAHFGQVVKYKCELGYTVDSRSTGDKSFTSACLTDGTYGELQACKPV